MKLADISASELLESGIFPSDFPPRKVPLWINGRNVVFRRGGVERQLTRTKLAEVSGGTITGLAQTRVAGTNRIYAGTEDTIYKIDSTVQPLGSGLGGGNWSFVVWGSWLLAANGIDPVKVWKNSGVLSDLAGTTFTRAKILVKRGTHVLAFGTSNGENVLEWCSSDNVELWAPAADNSAGALALRDLDGPIVAAIPLGDSIAVYTHDTMLLVNYLGAPLYFGARPALNGIGAAGRNTIVPVNRKNFGMSESGFFVTDGVSFTYIDSAIKDWFLANVARDELESAFGWHNEGNSEIIWMWPEVGQTSPSIGVVFNYLTGAWSIVDGALTAGIERQVYSTPLTAAGNKIYWEGVKNGDTLSGWIQTKPHALGGPEGELTDYWKFVDAVRFAVTTQTGVSVYVGVSETVDQVPVWEGPFTVTESSPWVYPRMSGVFLSIKIEGTDLWTLNGFEIHGDVAGRVL